MREQVKTIVGVCLQKMQKMQWTMEKTFDSFGPIAKKQLSLGQQRLFSHFATSYH